MISTTTLKEMCELVVDCPHFTPEWTSAGHIVIRNQNIRDGRLDLSNPSYTHKQDFDRRNRRAKPRSGDVIFTREAPMGEVCIVPDRLECCIGQRQVLLRPKKGLDGRYFFYALRSNFVRRQIFWNEGTGSTVSNVRIPVLEALKIPRLGASEPAIGQLLGALDDKIDLNRRMNETLEAMAQATFKDWFVDFGPTRAKMESRTPHLAPEIWGLFPDRLDNDGRPAKWEQYSLEAVADLCGGAVSALKEPTRIFEHYSLPAFDKGQEPALDRGEAIRSNKTSIPSGAVLLSKLNPEISRVWIPNDVNDAPQISSTEFLIFTPKSAAGRSLLYCLFRDPSFKQMLVGMVTGTSKSHQRVSPTALLKRRVLCGTPMVFHEFEKIASPLLRRMILNRAEVRSLTAIRDLLLPKLMSGEIHIRDAEKLAEMAA